MAPPIEKKVQASTVTAALSGAVLWVLGTYVFKGQEVPEVITSWVYVLAPAVVVAAAGYLAPHTHRPDVTPVAAGEHEKP